MMQQKILKNHGSSRISVQLTFHMSWFFYITVYHTPKFPLMIWDANKISLTLYFMNTANMFIINRGGTG
jgi:hypothetical protein